MNRTGRGTRRGTSSGVAKARPGRARAQPKFIPLMSHDLTQSASVVSAMVKRTTGAPGQYQ